MFLTHEVRRGDNVSRQVQPNQSSYPLVSYLAARRKLRLTLVMRSTRLDISWYDWMDEWRWMEKGKASSCPLSLMDGRMQGDSQKEEWSGSQ